MKVMRLDKGGMLTLQRGGAPDQHISGERGDGRHNKGTTREADEKVHAGVGASMMARIDSVYMDPKGRKASIVLSVIQSDY